VHTLCWRGCVLAGYVSTNNRLPTTTVALMIMEYSLCEALNLLHIAGDVWAGAAAITGTAALRMGPTHIMRPSDS
jgi:hypothetical protein